MKRPTYHVQTCDGVHVCGHAHTTLAGLARCRLTLLDYRCGTCGRARCRRRACGNQRVCSARWYNARLVATTANGERRRLTENEREALYHER